MKHLKIVLLSALLLSLAIWTSAQAQTSVAVDINKAKLMWDWTQGTGGVPAEFLVKCGTTSQNYTRITSVAPTLRELSVSSAITGSGNWFCTVSAANQFGESANGNEVPFVAGAVPSSPTNMRVTAQ